MTVSTENTEAPAIQGRSTDATTRAPRTWARPAIIAALVVVVVAAGAGWWLSRGGDGTVPYTDPRAEGILTLCDGDGHSITTGKVGAAPFVARAVGVTKAADQPGTVATLYAYQPREGLAPGEWSGQQLTASTTFADTTHPIAQATTKDGSLADFIAAFPADWDGLVHLRLYLSSPAFGVAGSYDAVTVKVDDGSWSVLGTAGTAGCAGEATSSETTLLDYPSASR